MCALAGIVYVETARFNLKDFASKHRTLRGSRTFQEYAGFLKNPTMDVNGDICSATLGSLLQNSRSELFCLLPIDASEKSVSKNINCARGLRRLLRVPGHRI